MKKFLPSLKDLQTSTAVILLASIILGAMALIWGLHVAAAGYIAILFLSPLATKLPLKSMIFPFIWLLAISALGILIAPLGPWALIFVVSLTAIVQGFFVFESGSLINRSPTTAVALSLTHHDSIWQPFLGVLVGSVVIIAIASLLGKHAQVPRSALLQTRLKYGFALAAGATLIAVIWQIFDLPYLTWALILFCLMFSFDRQNVMKLLALRAGGAITGALLALIMTALLPQPAIIVFAVVFAILEIAYIAENQIFLRMVFLTALLTFIAFLMHHANPTDELVHRFLAIIVPALIALALHFVIDRAKFLLRDTKLARLEQELKTFDEQGL